MSNIVVDDSHHVTSFTLLNANANIDAIAYHTKIESWNVQAGANYRKNGLKMSLVIGDSGSSFERAQLRTAVNANYGKVDVKITPSGSLEL